MNQVQVKIAGIDDMDSIMELRKEFLKSIKDGIEEKELSEFYSITKIYYEESFRKKEQITCLAYFNGELAGCATLCYLNVLPTLDHPSGLRGHLMNVYVRKHIRRNHIGTQILDLLIQEARKDGITEISLDATEDGRKLYENYGFDQNEEGMVFQL